MKILILSFYYSPDLCAGSFRTTALVEQLLKLPDLELDVITTMPNRYSSFNVVVDAEQDQQHVHIHRIKLPEHNSGMLDQMRAFLYFYRGGINFAKKNEYDLVFATSSRLFTAFLGARIANKKNIPLYLDIRDIFVDTLSDVINPYVFASIKPILTGIEKYTFSSARHINLVSKGFSDYFVSRFKRATYSFFTNGIDDTFIEDNSFNELVEENNSIKKVLYAGNIGEGQGLHHIIPDLAKNLEGQYHFIIIGDGGRRAILKESIANVGNVTLLPPVNRDELKKYYTAADILFLHLNDYAAFRKVLPSKIFEYVATRKPILAGVSGYAASFIESEIENAAIFSPGDVDTAELELQKLCKQPCDRSSFIAKYTRKSIMTKMSLSIISLLKKNL